MFIQELFDGLTKDSCTVVKENEHSLQKIEMPDVLYSTKDMAKAGFIHKPTDNSPDVAQCFFCYKELEGWEPEDDPLKEHKSHSPACNFILLNKAVEQLTVEEILKLQKERQKFHIKMSCKHVIEKFEEAAKSKRGDIIKLAMEG
ncbi:baculoviral IAP repeat-containing protein 5.2-like [Clarias magur]|uniref:Baculoviral IAP repeat-containing protein 5.2-like n=1 Tax=Clarias magur TaxID=1594786 RepID=A0A8J4UT52_CLAMG|nr:baculoviral IAP repeat-containing protein 5.2-like [Clarias magur]